MTRSRLLVVCCVGLVLLAGCTGLPAGSNPGDDTPSDTSSQSPSPIPAGTPNGTLAVHFINVGQSVSTLLVGPTGETMLIDTGHFTDDGAYVLQYLQRLGIERIDYLVTTHNDADHIGGNAAVIDYYETEAAGIGTVYDPGIAASTDTYEEYLDAIERHDVALYETREGDTIPFEGVDLQVLGPPEPYLENEARNENSIVLRMSFGRTSFLFTGDAEDDQEAYLVEQYGGQLDATVLKAGHHGSSSSTSGPLLDAAAPKAVVISSAYDSQYGHPNEDTLQRLVARDVRTYWTATHGHVVLTSDGSQVRVRTQRDAPTDPQILRDGSPVAVGSTDPVRPRAIITGEGVGAASATASPTPIVATDGGASPGQGDLVVAEINADAAGDDRENLIDEYIILKNTGGTEINLTGWTVSDAAGRTYTFPDGFVLEPGGSVTLHTGSGTDTVSDLYWDSGSPIWNNDGDTVIITNADEDTVLTKEYTS